MILLSYSKMKKKELTVFSLHGCKELDVLVGVIIMYSPKSHVIVCTRMEITKNVHHCCAVTIVLQK